MTIWERLFLLKRLLSEMILSAFAVTFLALLGCDGLNRQNEPVPPKTFSECLAMATTHKDKAAMRVAEQLCERAFGQKQPSGEELNSPKKEDKKETLQGSKGDDVGFELFMHDTFYFKTKGAECASISLSTAKQNALMKNGFCYGGARTERSKDGLHFVTCKNHNGTEKTVVFRVSKESKGKKLLYLSTEFSPNRVSLYFTEAECRLDITPEEIKAAQTKTVADTQARIEHEQQMSLNKKARERLSVKSEKEAKELRVRCCECFLKQSVSGSRCFEHSLEDCEYYLKAVPKDLPKLNIACNWYDIHEVCGLECAGFIGH